MAATYKFMCLALIFVSALASPCLAADVSVRWIRGIENLIPLSLTIEVIDKLSFQTSPVNPEPAYLVTEAGYNSCDHGGAEPLSEFTVPEAGEYYFIPNQVLCGLGLKARVLAH